MAEYDEMLMEEFDDGDRQSEKNDALSSVRVSYPSLGDQSSRTTTTAGAGSSGSQSPCLVRYPLLDVDVSSAVKLISSKDHEMDETRQEEGGEGMDQLSKKSVHEASGKLQISPEELVKMQETCILEFQTRAKELNQALRGETLHQVEMATKRAQEKQMRDEEREQRRQQRQKELEQRHEEREQHRLKKLLSGQWHTNEPLV